ncbi:hypothetical protein F3X86_19200 [Aeromonas veronii]|uniref:hypothetical protein n=1 Tax=Aeromonas veronii TaxID=654 RepID=UPI00124429D6|nr:hypothetical protein [Aeromonas veronii]KAB0663733.1 hypothetical protein F3X86_19200 [Aeromonas veronii]
MDLMNTTTALVISVASGILGVGLQRYWSRCKPMVNITALGFEGDVVEIPDEIIKLRDKCVWSDSLDSFVQFETLLQKERDATQVLAALQKTKEIVDNWLEKITLDGDAKQLGKNKLLRTPIVSDGRLINATIMGALKRKDFPELPAQIEEVELLENIFPIEEAKDGNSWSVHCGRFGINYKNHNFSEQETKTLKNIAKSLSSGHSKNIIFLHEYYSNFAGAEIYNEEKLVKSLRRLIIENAKISMAVNISNIGQTPIIFKPYMAAKLVFGQMEKSFVMKTQVKSEPYKMKFDDMVRTDDFLHSSDPSPHIAVSGGSSIDIKLVSIDKIGSESELVSEFYELGGLQGKLFIKNLEDKVFSSKLIHFGKNVSADEHKKLIECSK